VKTAVATRTRVAIVNEAPIKGEALKLCETLFGAYGDPELSFHSVNEKRVANRAVSKAMPQRDRLIGELRDSGAEKILVCGGITRAVLRGETKARAMADVHGRSEWINIQHEDENGHQVYSIPTFSPYECLTSREGEFAFRDFHFAVEKLCRRDRPLPSLDELPLEFDVIETPAQLIESLAELSEASYLGCDIETEGFAAGDLDILSIGFCARTEGLGGYGIVIPHWLLDIDLNAENRVRRFFAEYRGLFVGHNFKFDIQHLQAKGIVRGDLNLRDTMLLGHLLDERPVGSRFKVHGLKAQLRKRFDFPDYGLDMQKWLDAHPDKEWRTEIHFEGSEELYSYQFLDTYGTCRLYEEELEEVEEEDPQQFEIHDGLQMPVSQALAEVEYGGILCDRPYFMQWQKELHKDLAKHEREIKRLAKKFGEPDLNVASSQQLNKLFYDALDFDEVADWKMGGTHRSTDKDAIKALRKQAEKRDDGTLPLINALGEYKRKAKIASTFVDNLITFSEATGRIHPDLNIAGTVSGRLSSWKPNLQNVPGTMAGNFGVRNGFIADPGYKLIDADYSQLELRVAGLMSDDQDLLQAFRDGADIHMAVGQRLWQKDTLTKQERMLAKMTNFGIVYQRGYRSIAEGREMEYMLEETGTKWKEAEVKAFYDSYRNNYPTLFAWIDEQKVYAVANQFVQTLTGRRRRFTFVNNRNKNVIERQAVNAPIQGSAAELTLDALVRVHRRFKVEVPDAAVLLTVHDSILAQAPKKQAKRAAEIVREEMEDNLPTWIAKLADDRGCPMKADVEIKDRWGEGGTPLEEWEKYARHDYK
jgi:DNA polymerase-1